MGVYSVALILELPSLEIVHLRRVNCNARKDSGSIKQRINAKRLVRSVMDITPIMVHVSIVSQDTS